MDLADYITNDGSLCIPKKAWQALCNDYAIDELAAAFLDLTTYWKQPLIPCSEQHALTSFAALRSMTPYSMVRQDSGVFRHGPAFSGMCVVGDIKIGKHASTYFSDRYRWHASYRSMPSPFNGWVSPDVILKTVKSLSRKSTEITDFVYKHDLFNHAKLVSHFSPAIAKVVYAILGGGHVLDMCAGWGDRLAGALACNQVTSYTGMDTNTSMLDGYVHQYETYGKPKPCSFYSSDAGSFDFTSIAPVSGFDIAFTSPPYFNLEKYPNMPEHYLFRDWVSLFLQPMMESAFDSLKSGGYLALNVGNFKSSAAADHIDIAEACRLFMDNRYCLRLQTTIGMMIPPRFPSKEHQQKILEPILVWRKP